MLERHRTLEIIPETGCFRQEYTVQYENVYPKQAFESASRANERLQLFEQFDLHFQHELPDAAAEQLICAFFPFSPSLNKKKRSCQQDTQKQRQLVHKTTKMRAVDRKINTVHALLVALAAAVQCSMIL